ETDASAGPSIQVDLRVLPLDRWGAALMYFTGSKDHNIRLRERAQKMGMTLSDWGLFVEDGEKEPPHTRGVKPFPSATEEEVYAKLGLAWIPPEVREDRGEIELAEMMWREAGENAVRKGKKAAAAAAAIRLIEVSDIKAELHAHTTASDGSFSIEELAERAKA